MRLFIFLTCFQSLVLVDANCGISPCAPPQPFYQPYQAYQQQSFIPRYQIPQTPPQVQPTIQYYYPANSYAVAPPTTIQQQQPAQVMTQVDKETTVSTGKSNYDEFEKELDKLKPSATVIKTEEETVGSTEVNATITLTNSSVIPDQTVTYVREFASYAPEGYALRPLPYRPVPYIPRGCPTLPPTQYLQPTQYIIQQPRGYVQPAPPPPQPLPQPAPSLQQVGYVTPPSVRPVLPPPINDCCGKCGAPCKFRSRKHVIALASKIFTASFIPRRDSDDEDEPKDPKCNSEKLKDIMNRFITRTIALSKRLIQKNAEKELGVFCSTDDFSYVARSETFCQHQKNDIICYAFKHK